MLYEPLVERSDRSDVVCGRDEPVEADTAYRHAEQEEVAAMKLSRQKILFWLPRGLGLLFAGFLGLFALDVFGAGYGFWETAVALLMHLIPTIVLLIVLGLSWRWPWIGAIGFVGFAIWYVITSWARFPVSVYVMLAGWPFLLGLLFLADWWQRRGDRSQSTAARPT